MLIPTPLLCISSQYGENNWETSGEKYEELFEGNHFLKAVYLVFSEPSGSTLGEGQRSPKLSLAAEPRSFLTQHP